MALSYVVDPLIPTPSLLDPMCYPYLDYHIHSGCSVDSETDMEAHCQRAIELGLSELCFTEHVDFDPAEVHTGYFVYERYQREIRANRERFGDRLVIRSGAEIDYNHRFEEDIAASLRGTAFDFVLGSVHYLDGFNVSEPRSADYFRDRELLRAYGRYFEEVQRCVDFGLFDVLGHLDLVKRYGVDFYGPFDLKPFAEGIERILRTVVESGMGIEINTSGIRQRPRETYPGLDVLRMYKRLGGQVLSVGSDAHTVDDLARDIRAGLRQAKQAGFEAIWTFEARRGYPRALERPGGVAEGVGSSATEIRRE